MLFNSFEFLVFFPVVAIIYFLLPHRFRWFHLLAASCYFYMAFIPAYLVIVLTITMLTYFSGMLVERATGKKRRRMLAAAVVLNILILCFFKYYYFFVSDVNELIRSSGLTFSLPLVLLFPLGLSFQTFQALSYLFEINRGTIKAEKHAGIFSLYIMFFPKLVAGPIERPQALIPQFREVKYFDRDNAMIGFKMILWGFFKKLVIADRLAIYVSHVYSDPESAGTINLWLAVFVFFPVQLYCDFSGYSSIAIGTAKVMGFDLTENFRKPFASLTTSEFWNRWHISLSTWLRDYIYQPFVIQFRDYGKWAVVSGLMVTFFVSGFWHGAGAGFLVYGLVQGAVIAGEYLLGIKSSRLAKSTMGRIRGILVTYFFFSFSLIFFRSADLGQAMTVIRNMFWYIDLRVAFTGNIPLLTYFLSVASIVFLFLFEGRNRDQYLYRRTTFTKEVAVTSSLVIALIAFGIFHNLSFIYFQF